MNVVKSYLLLWIVLVVHDATECELLTFIEISFYWLYHNSLLVCQRPQSPS